MMIMMMMICQKINITTGLEFKFTLKPQLSTLAITLWRPCIFGRGIERVYIYMFVNNALKKFTLRRYIILFRCVHTHTHIYCFYIEIKKKISSLVSFINLFQVYGDPHQMLNEKKLFACAYIASGENKIKKIIFHFLIKIIFYIYLFIFFFNPKKISCWH